MAYPIIRSVSSGQLTTPNTSSFTITLPSGIQSGDVLVGSITCSPNATAVTLDPTSSSNFTNRLYYTNTWGWSQTGTYLWWVYGYDTPVTNAYFTVKALGDGNDSLKVITYLANYNFGSTNSVSEYLRNAKLSYYCYCFSYFPWHIKFWRVASSTAVSNWDFGPKPSGVSSDWTTDSLWLFLLGSPGNLIPTDSPSGFSPIEGTTGSSLVPFSSSTCTTYKMTTGVNQIDPGPFVNPSSVYIGSIMRIMESPTEEEEPEPDPPEPIVDGFYVPMYSKQAYVANEVEDYIEIDLDELRFSDNTDACSAGNLIIVNANGDWTASWSDGSDFDASTYSGTTGTTYLYITCQAINYSGDILSDMLTLTKGVTNVYVGVYQNSVGNGCTW